MRHADEASARAADDRSRRARVGIPHDADDANVRAEERAYVEALATALAAAELDAKETRRALALERAARQSTERALATPPSVARPARLPPPPTRPTRGSPPPPPPPPRAKQPSKTRRRTYARDWTSPRRAREPSPRRARRRTRETRGYRRRELRRARRWIVRFSRRALRRATSPRARRSRLWRNTNAQCGRSWTRFEWNARGWAGPGRAERAGRSPRARKSTTPTTAKVAARTGPRRCTGTGGVPWTWRGGWGTREARCRRRRGWCRPRRRREEADHSLVAMSARQYVLIQVAATSRRPSLVVLRARGPSPHIPEGFLSTR